MKILEVKNLSKVYGKGETMVKALDNVSFSVEQGEFVAIIGPSGSGKSTLLHILGGVDTPTNGSVIINNTDISTLNETALAIFPLLLDGRKPDKRLIESLVNRLGLSKRLTHLPNQLSGGQQQRVSIGRALVNNPALMLADEPTGNLDSENSKEIISLLRKLNKENNQTVIIITHDEKIALSADRIISVQDGKIIGDEVNMG